MGVEGQAKRRKRCTSAIVGVQTESLIRQEDGTGFRLNLIGKGGYLRYRLLHKLVPGCVNSKEVSGFGGLFFDFLPK